MAFQVGEKVTILPFDVEEDSTIGGVNMVREMEHYIEQEVTIARVYAGEQRYRIREDEGEYVWPESIFEGNKVGAIYLFTLKDSNRIVAIRKENIVSVEEFPFYEKLDVETRMKIHLY